MGLSSTLYEVSKSNFAKIKNDTSLFKSDISESYEVFEKNFFGLEFILKKTLDKKYTETIDEIFIPKEYLGELVDITHVDFFEIWSRSISYLNPKLIKEINTILNAVSTNQFASNYDSCELNEKGIYPRIWHNDESLNQAFNKRDITNAIERLKSIINRAEKNGSYIFVFSG